MRMVWMDSEELVNDVDDNEGRKLGVCILHFVARLAPGVFCLSIIACVLPRSPHPTYMMISLFENLDNACEMTVFPQPNAPGMAVVPP